MLDFQKVGFFPSLPAAKQEMQSGWSCSTWQDPLWKGVTHFPHFHPGLQIAATAILKADRLTLVNKLTKEKIWQMLDWKCVHWRGLSNTGVLTMKGAIWGVCKPASSFPIWHDLDNASSSVFLPCGCLFFREMLPTHWFLYSHCLMQTAFWNGGCPWEVLSISLHWDAELIILFGFWGRILLSVNISSSNYFTCGIKTKLPFLLHCVQTCYKL